MYEVVSYFHHMLEARHFTILTNHVPPTFTFKQKKDKISPRQFNHLDLISQFMKDIRNISGQDSIVADALSRIEIITAPVSMMRLPQPRTMMTNYGSFW
jgi:hypothetical protein